MQQLFFREAEGSARGLIDVDDTRIGVNPKSGPWELVYGALGETQQFLDPLTFREFCFQLRDSPS
jgi:hypothetical protein